MRRHFPFFAALVVCPLLLACGHKKPQTSNNTSGSPSNNGIAVTPSTATLSTGQSKALSANVSATDQTVFWSIVGATPENGDTQHGFISNGGVYIAPAAVPSGGSVTVEATSASDATKTGTAILTIQAAKTSVTISPGNATVSTFGSMQFTSNTAVNWQVNGANGGSASTGTISTAGLFSAPNSVPVLTTGNNSGQTSEVVVTAVAQADNTSSDSVLVTIVPPQQGSQTQPTPLGVSGGNSRDSSMSGGSVICCGGTLGSLVSRGGTQFILSNNHVLARSDIGSAGDPIVQPGLIDNNCNVPPAVASLSQFFNLENGPTPKVDAALAQVNAGAVDSLGTILQLGGTNNGNQPTNGPPHAGSGIAATVGQNVAKSGRSTGLTCSKVFATNVSTIIEYQKGCGTGSTFSTTFTNQVDISNVGFSAEGDSGSLVVTQNTADAVGLLFAGSDTDTTANPVSDVLNALADPNNPGSKPVFVGMAATHAVAACTLPGPQSAMAANLALPKAQASADALQLATAARDAHVAEILGHAEVQAAGVGASYDNPGEAAIVFFLSKGQSRANLPAQIDGVRTRIVQTGATAGRGILSAEETAALEESAAPAQIVYSLSRAEFARAKIVHAAHVDEWMKKSGVQGVGIGSSVDSPGEAALVIFLIRGEAHEAIPSVIDGLRTRVRVSSRFRAGFGNREIHHGCVVPSVKKAKAR